DEYQGLGLGTELLQRLIEVGKEEGDIGRIVAYMLTENQAMKRIAENLGFKLKFEDQMLKAVLSLNGQQ
ncbi:MAG: GNAT family N-acetyltransferase, partial [Candidatus Promineifilaceae bacterium]|nr:GNAT family N-acetyltransferase [Candidatus Promineifilaceae bacterium]